ncbi:MAG TPA: hypothetical protein VFX09_00850 [Burkholderiales bacterium]|nr:hypothetical protein [Burkholderiales bacterium]
MPRFSGVLLLALAACAQAPPKAPESSPASRPVVAPLPALPATYGGASDCAGCAAVTLQLRPDGAFLLRERLGPSEFADFGRWRRLPDGTLELQGSREAKRRYAPRPDGSLEVLEGPGERLRREAAAQPIRGPFRMVGLYDGRSFTDCSTGLAWPLDESRAGAELMRAYRASPAGAAGRPALVSIDARLENEGTPQEEIRVQRIPAVLSGSACPG